MAANISTYGEIFSSPTVTPEIQKALVQTRNYAEMRIKQRTPVDTGRLRASWDLKLANKGLSIVNPQPYAGFVDLGTRKMAARPMVEPTVTEAQEFFADRLAAEIARKLSAQITANVSKGRGSAKTQVARTQQQRARATAQAATIASNKRVGLTYNNLTEGTPKPLPQPKRSKSKSKRRR